MARVCPGCAWEMPDRFAFCGRCGARLDTTPAHDEGERQVTCVFADVSGFTSLAEQLEPEALHAVMRMAWDAMAAEIRRHDGILEKYIGDAVVAVFGAPVAHEDHPQRALSATLGVLLALEHVNEEIEPKVQRRLALRIGVNTGVVMAGAIGDRESDYGVLGDAVNVAARLQQAARTDEVLVGEATYRAAAWDFAFEAHPPVLAKGRSEPIVTWRLAGRRPPVTPARAPLVGRDALLRLLWRELDEAAAGNGRPVSLVGEPGMGVSRVVQAVLADSRATAFRVAHVACTPYDRARPYAVLEEILRGVLAITDADPLERARRLLADLLPGLEPEVRELVLEMVGHPGLARPLAPSTRRRLMVRGARDVLRRIAETQPVLVVVEDAHDMDSASRRALGEIAAALVASRVCVLVTRPPGEPLPWRRGTPALELRVDPLDPAGARALLEALAAAPLDAALVDRALALAGGSPALLEELAQRLDDVAKPGAAARELAEERLGRLPKEDLHVLSSAAVIGRAFDRPLLRAAVGTDADVDGALTRLIAGGLLAETPFGALRFRHGGLREAVYGGIPARMRGEMHGRVALAIEGHRPEVAQQRPELLALHLAPSPYAIRAIDYAVRAAQHALAVDEPEAAAEQLRAAVEIAERAPGGEAEGVRVLALLAEVEWLRKDEGAAAEALERLLAQTTDPRAALALHVRLGLVLAEAGAVDAAAKHLAHADRDATGDTRDRALLSLAKANLAAHTGQALEARLLAQEAAGFARGAGDTAIELDCLAALDRWDATAGRHTDRAPALCRALELAAAAGDLVRAAETCAALAGLPGEPLEERDRYARQAQEHFAQLGDDAGRSRSLRALARLRLEAGDLDDAERALGEALALARAQDSDTESGHALYLLGHTALRREDLPTAEAYLAEALASSDPAEPHLRARCLVALARLAARAGDDETARARIAEADATVGDDCARCVAQLSVVAAELALEHGDLAEARTRCSRGLERALRGQLAEEIAALRALTERLSAPV